MEMMLKRRNVFDRMDMILCWLVDDVRLDGDTHYY